MTIDDLLNLIPPHYEVEFKFDPNADFRDRWFCKLTPLEPSVLTRAAANRQHAKAWESDLLRALRSALSDIGVDASV